MPEETGRCIFENQRLDLHYDKSLNDSYGKTVKTPRKTLLYQDLRLRTSSP
jgi:hypothetical protein